MGEEDVPYVACHQRYFTYSKIYYSNRSVGDSQIAVQPVLTWQTNLALLTYLVSMFVNNVKWNKRSKGKV